jgi:hypothetical protein
MIIVRIRRGDSGANCQISHFNNLIIINLYVCFRQYMTPPKNGHELFDNNIQNINRYLKIV